MIEQRITRLFNSKGIPVHKISHVGKGINSSVYRVTGDRPYGFKMAMFPERKFKVLNEIKIRQKFIDRGIECIPKVHFSDTEFFPDSAVVFDFIDGEKPDFTNKAVLVQFANTIAEIHKLDLKVVDNGYDLMYRSFTSLLKLERRSKSKYKDLVNEPFLVAINNAISCVLIE